MGTSYLQKAWSKKEIEVRLSDIDRLRHLYIIGKTGTGKTNLLKLMASQDVKIAGRGVTIIDPHGDLVDHVLSEIPESRISEVTLLDLAQTESLPVLNPLDFNREDSRIRDRTIQELVWLMTSRVFHQFTGPRFEELVRLALLTMLDEGYPEPASLVEVPRILMDENIQSVLANLVKDHELRERWRFQEEIRRDHEYGGLIHYVTAKFADIARDTTLRVVLGGAKSTVNIENIVENNRILLVRIPEADIGRQAADLIGSLVLLRLQMAIMRRGRLKNGQGYHFVYVDEFQNFANTDFHTLVSESRKFGIGFALANQNLEQLREFRNHTGVHEQRLINAVLGNIANFIVFGIGVFDAQVLTNHLNVSVEDLMHIGRYEAVARILANGFDTSSFTLLTTEAVKQENYPVVSSIERLRGTYVVNSAQTLEEIQGRLNRVMKSTRPSTRISIIGDDVLPRQDSPTLPQHSEETEDGIVVNEDVLTINKCPKCTKTHKYKFEVQRSPMMFQFPPPRIKQYFTRLFTCPNTGEDFQARFYLFEGQDTVESVTVKGLVQEPGNEQISTS